MIDAIAAAAEMAAIISAIMAFVFARSAAAACRSAAIAAREAASTACEAGLRLAEHRGLPCGPPPSIEAILRPVPACFLPFRAHRRSLSSPRASSSVQSPGLVQVVLAIAGTSSMLCT